MLNQQEKTERFAAEINRNAAKAIQKIEKQTEKITKSQLAELEQEAAADIQSRMDDALRRIQNDANREKGAYLLSRRREAANHRDEIVTKVFSLCEEKLCAFRETKQYADLLEKSIRALAACMEDGCTVYVGEADLSAATDICKSIDTVKDVKPRDSIRLGLAEAENEDKTMFLSDTFDTRLASYRESFLASCGLRVLPEEVIA